MSVRASPITSVTDFAGTVVLRERGLYEAVDHHEPGIQVPRRGTPFWETKGDFDWRFRITFDAQGAGPFAVEIWAANGPNVPDACVASVMLPENSAGEVFGIVSADNLRIIPTASPLFLSCKLRVGGGQLDAGVELVRAN